MDEPRANEPQGPVSAFWSSVTDVLSLLMDLVYTRVELLFLDLQDGVERLVSMLLWGLIGLWAAAMTLLLGALTLIIVFWDTHRVLAAGSITALFAALTLLALWRVRRRLRGSVPLFAATLEEFERDRQRMRGRASS